MGKSPVVKAALFMALCAVASAVYALEVDEDELRRNGADIEFINYTGPHDRIDSLESIQAIGNGLGNAIAPAPATATAAGARNRYYVVHAVDPTESGKLDADIIYIGADATVDHIVNVRRIVAAYLRSAYSYSQADADAIAVFVTVYNAVYRGNRAAYEQRYKSAVMQNLSAENCGIALSYRDWPGKTEMVIPLYDVVRGGISTVDTSVISDSRVVESMREDDDRNVDARQQMVDIKEREADEASSAAQEAQRQATQEQRAAEQQTARAEQAARQSEQAAQRAEQAEQRAAENPRDREAQREAQAARQEAERTAEEAAAAQTAAEEQQHRAEEARQEAAEEQARADRKQNEAQLERTEIARDVQEIVREQAAAASAPSVYGLQLTDEARQLSGLVQVNANNGAVLRQSPVVFIRNRTVYKATDGYVAIAGENSGTGTVKLVVIDPVTLTISATSAERVAEDSVLVQDGTDYYCVIQDGAHTVVAKYGEDMVLKLKSSLPVKSDTPITDTGSMLLVTGSTNTVYLLDKANLRPITE
ncbi:MAG: hypothetical protein IJ191_10400 [Treponema sp.]|nr:hypothetical protein [Treponema sp.]